VSLYEEVVTVTSDYLGPAAQRFIDRQIESHLEKKPQEISPTDLKKLVEWCKVSLALLTQDKDEVDKYAERLSGLTTKAR